MSKPTETTFSIKRFHPETDVAPRWQKFEVETKPGMTVHEGLQRIREQQDPTLSWRYSCRMGVCGSCAMVINGKPGLACNNLVHAISETHIKLEPLWNFAVVKDLVADLAPAFDQHRRLKPYLIRADTDSLHETDRELSQTPDELLDYLQFSYCIKCCACIAACPTVAMDKQFPGPMPLTAAHRYNADSRDDGFELRKSALDDYHSVSHCHYAGECSRVCPRGVDPARAIQLMKRDLVMELFGAKRRQPAEPVPEGRPAPRDVTDALRPPEVSVRQEPTD